MKKLADAIIKTTAKKECPAFHTTGHLKVSIFHFLLDGIYISFFQIIF